MKRYNVSANRYNDVWNIITFQQTVITVSETIIMTGTRVRAAGKRVRVQRFFSKKKTNRPLSNLYPCTRLPAYTLARVRVVPGGF
jgi:3'-phosphoadenosine 5'-phosphosulfate sulfotransferase (PAPS reductase)/FAD synthetase